MKRFLVLIVLLSCLILTSSLFAQWTMTNGPIGGFVDRITGNNEGLFIVAGNGNTYFRKYSDDRWTLLCSTGLNQITGAYIQDSTFYISTFYSGIWKSNDYGYTWQKIPRTVVSDTVWSICGDDSTILAGTFQKGLFVSNDNGETWNRNRAGGIYLVNIYNSVYYFYDRNYLYYSTNKGGSWSKPTYQAMNDWLFTMAECNYRTFVGGYGGVFISYNKGVTWTNTESDLLANYKIIKLCTIDNVLFAVADGVGLFKTIDYGKNWSNISLNMINLHISDLYAKDGVLYAASSGAGVLKSTDLGETWELFNEGLERIGVNSIEVFHDSLFVMTKGRGVSFTTDMGDTWCQSSTENMLWGEQHLVKYNNFLLSTSDEGMFKLNCISKEWEKICDDRFNNCFVFENKLFAHLNNKGYCCSNDTGKTWILKESGLPAGSRYDLTSVDNILFGAIQYDGVYRSINGGESWQKVEGISLFNEITKFAGKLFAASYSDGVYVSTNNGVTWSKESDIWGTVLYSCYNDLFMGAASGKVYRYNKTDETWELISPFAYTTSSKVTEIEAYNGYLFVGIANTGLYKCPLSDVLTTVEENDVNILNDFTLSQNYPNPFNPSTTIAFSIPTSAFVTLKIYDVLGKEVANLCNEELSAGKYSRNWDANKFASGMYVYQIKAGDFVSSKKLMLMK